MGTDIRELSRHLTDDELVEKITEFRTSPPADLSPIFARGLANALELELGARCEAHLTLFGLL